MLTQTRIKSALAFARFESEHRGEHSHVMLLSHATRSSNVYDVRMGIFGNGGGGGGLQLRCACEMGHKQNESGDETGVRARTRGFQVK